MEQENKIKHGTISINEISKNGNILSPNYYLNILPKLKESIKFISALNPNFERTIKLNLDDLNLDTKLLIYSLLEDREKLKKIEGFLKGGLEKLK